MSGEKAMKTALLIKKIGSLPVESVTLLLYAFIIFIYLFLYVLSLYR